MKLPGFKSAIAAGIGAPAIITLLLVLPSFFPAAKPAVQKREMSPPTTYSLKNGPAQRVLGIQGDVLAYSAITSTAPGQVAPVLGEEFALRLRERTLYCSEDFVVRSVSRPEPGALDFRLEARELPLTVLLHYRQASGSHFIRKWLELQPGPGEKFFLHSLALEDFQAFAETRQFPGRGQPVFVGDTFWGVAYPSALNRVEKGTVICGYLAGLTIGEEGYVSREAVYGVAAKGRVEEQFQAYIDEVRARPVRPFLLYNTWYDLRNYSEEEIIASLKGLERNLAKPAGIDFDAVVLDDGWDDFRELWKPHHKRFPRGLEPVQEAAARLLHARLGLWMSPAGGYLWNQQRRIWNTLGKGYEKNPLGFCFAGQDYRALFTKRMTEYAEKGVVYFKLDNLRNTCYATWHGHRAGLYAQEALTDAFIDTLEKVRAARPEVMINFTVGSWLSPWWLLYADVLWRGGMDYGFAGEGSPRQRAITYVDKIMFKRFREEKAWFPINSIMTHGIIKGRYQNFKEEGENLKDFSDDAWMFFGRGVMMWELYLSPDLLSAGEWKALQQALRFAREHADTLLGRSRMLLGNPETGEIYGYLHPGKDEIIIALRNPAKTEQELPSDFRPASLLPLPDSRDKKTAEKKREREEPGEFTWRTVYPSDHPPPWSALRGLETRIILGSRSN